MDSTQVVVTIVGDPYADLRLIIAVGAVIIVVLVIVVIVLLLQQEE